MLLIAPLNLSVPFWHIAYPSSINPRKEYGYEIIHQWSERISPNRVRPVEDSMQQAWLEIVERDPEAFDDGALITRKVKTRPSGSIERRNSQKRAWTVPSKEMRMQDSPGNRFWPATWMNVLKKTLMEEKGKEKEIQLRLRIQLQRERFELNMLQISSVSHRQST